MTKRTQAEEIRLLRGALRDLYIVHTGLGTMDRWGALAHLHCQTATGTGVLDTKRVEAGVVKHVESVLKDTQKAGY